jgi:hypothetical protein
MAFGPELVVALVVVVVVYCWGISENPDNFPEHKRKECEHVQRHG